MINTRSPPHKSVKKRRKRSPFAASPGNISLHHITNTSHPIYGDSLISVKHRYRRMNHAKLKKILQSQKANKSKRTNREQPIIYESESLLFDPTPIPQKVNKPKPAKAPNHHHNQHRPLERMQRIQRHKTHKHASKPLIAANDIVDMLLSSLQIIPIIYWGCNYRDIDHMHTASMLIISMILSIMFNAVKSSNYMLNHLYVSLFLYFGFSHKF